MAKISPLPPRGGKSAIQLIRVERVVTMHRGYFSVNMPDRGPRPDQSAADIKGDCAYRASGIHALDNLKTRRSVILSGS
jgi:hypothetical protein